LGITFEDFLEGIESGFIFVFSLWHAIIIAKSKSRCTRYFMASTRSYPTTFFPASLSYLVLPFF
jgi:hypothetical protein